MGWDGKQESAGGYYGGHQATVKPSGRGNKYPNNNFFEEGNYRIRFLIPRRTSGALLGKKGTIIMNLQESSGSRINIDYAGDDEKILNIKHDTREGLCDTVDLIANQIYNEFKDVDEDRAKPPMVLVGKQKSDDHTEHVQLCLILHQTDVKTFKKEGVCKNLLENTGVDAFVHHRYASGSDTLPNSEEKIITLTGEPANMKEAIAKIVDCLEDNYEKNPKSFDVKECGHSEFFGNVAAGLNRIPNHNKMMGQQGQMMGQMAGQMMGGQMMGGMMGQMGQMGGMGQMGMMGAGALDPFVQKLEIKAFSNNNFSTWINKSQIGEVLGKSGARVQQIQNMSGATVIIEVPGKEEYTNKFVREIKVAGQLSQCQNAMWLIQICINAFCDKEVSLAPFDSTTSLAQVMASGAYGMAPAL